MFEDFFVTYNAVDPPEIYKEHPELMIEDIKDDELDFNLEDFDLIDIKSPFEDYPEDSPENSSNDNDLYLENPFYKNNVERAKKIVKKYHKDTDLSLIKIDIEDLLKQEGITSVNGKPLKFGSKELRGNVNYGAKNSNHKKRDPDTGNTMARDISIVGGNTLDYNTFKYMLLANPRIVKWFSLKGWGIINEVTPQILSKTRGTGPHFHFGPDTMAIRTWNAWLNNPNVDVTRMINKKASNFEGIKTTSNRAYNSLNIAYINNKLSSINPLLRSVILANIIEESGGDPLAVGPGGFYGLLQWSPSRYAQKSKDRKKELDNQILYILNTLDNITDRKSWNHGGEGSGYSTTQDAHNAFKNSNSIDNVNKAYTLGYVRPSGRLLSAKNRLKVAKQIYERIK